MFRDLHYKTITIDEAESKQDEFNTVLDLLKKYSPMHDKYVTLKNNLIDNVSKFYEGREKIIEGFKNEVFPFYYDREDEEQMEFEKEEEEETITDDLMNGLINKKQETINKELFKNYFSFQTPSALLKELYKTNDKEKNRLLVSVMNSGLKDLKKEIKELSKGERKIEKPDKIVKIVKKFSSLVSKTKKDKD